VARSSSISRHGITRILIFDKRARCAVTPLSGEAFAILPAAADRGALQGARTPARTPVGVIAAASAAAED
jgi:hypothetical protein